MSQNFTTLVGTDTLNASRTIINNSLLALLSQFSGTAFPATPTVGQTCLRTDEQRLYLCTATGPSVWLLLRDLTAGIGGGPVVSATAPAGPTNGQLWFHTEEGELLIYYDDGNTGQWVSTTGSIDYSAVLLKASNGADIADKEVFRANIGLSRKRLDLSGLSSLNFVVPATAKALRLEGFFELSSAVNTFAVLRAGFAGAFVSSADYGANGFTHNPATSTFTHLSNSMNTGALFVAGGDNANVKQFIRGFVPLDRLTTSDTFTFDTSGMSYSTSSGAQHSTLNTYLVNNTGSNLRITDFQLVINSGTWGAGSHVWIEWMD